MHGFRVQPRWFNLSPISGFPEITVDPERRLDLYKEMYYYELQHRDSITEHLSWSLPIIAALGAGILYLINNAPGVAWNLVEVIYLIATAAALFCWIMAVFYMAQAWWGVEYGYLALPSKLESWFATLEKHKAEYPSAPETADVFMQGIIGSLAETTRNNRDANQRKSWKHHLSKRWVLATTVLIAAAFVSDYLWKETTRSTTKTPTTNERQAIATPTPPASAGGLLQGGKQTAPTTPSDGAGPMKK